MGFQTTDWRPGDPANTILGKILAVLKSGSAIDAASLVDLATEATLTGLATEATLLSVLAALGSPVAVSLATKLDSANDSIAVDRKPGAANITALQFTTAAAAGEALAARATRRKVQVKNMDAIILIYLGADSLVSSTTGFPLTGGATIELETTDAIWAIPASGTPKLAFIEIYD